MFPLQYDRQPRIPAQRFPLDSPKALDKPTGSNSVVPVVWQKNQGLAGLGAFSGIAGGSVGWRDFPFSSGVTHLQ